MKKAYKITLALLLSLAAATEAAAAEKKSYCGSLENGYGPFDYRSPSDPNALSLVERYHFNDDVEQGLAGMSSNIGGDLDYTLRAFPNHARALATLIRLAQRDKIGSTKLNSSHFATECYFERAVRFRPDDGTAWALYAQYLHVIGEEARVQPMLEKAAELSPDNPSINYNLGLLYARQKNFDKALPFAQKAYASGFPLPALKQLLVDARKWVEPPRPAPTEAAKDEAKTAGAEAAKPAAEETAKQ